MVLGLVPYRVPRSGLGARRQTGRSPANSYGTVSLPYPRSLTQGVPLSSQARSAATLAGARDLGTRASGTAGRALSELSSLGCEHMATHGGTQSVAGIVDIRRLAEQCESSLAPRGPFYRVDGPSGFTQAAENHGRTISERHNRTPRRRVHRGSARPRRYPA